MIVVQAGGAILVHVSELSAQPVKDRHEVVHNYLDAEFREVFQRGAVVLDVFVTAGQPELDVLVDVHRFDDLAFEPGFVNLVNKNLNFVLFPVLPGRLVGQGAHNSGHARNLLDVLQRNGVVTFPVPAECHFH